MIDGLYLLESEPSIFSASSRLTNQFLNSSGEVEYAFFLIKFVSNATCFSKDDAPKAEAPKVEAKKEEAPKAEAKKEEKK